MYLLTSDESEPSWLEPQLDLKYFQLRSARLVIFFLQLVLFFSARKSENYHFLPPRFFFLISPAFSLYFWFTLLQIILFLLKMTIFWSEKKNVAKNGNFLIFELKKKFELKEKSPRVEPSRAENASARAMARASSARTHHQTKYILR